MEHTNEGCILIDRTNSLLPDSNLVDSNSHVSELYLKLLKLEQETELLRDLNRSLREENIFLKESLKQSDRWKCQGCDKSSIGSWQEHSPKNPLSANYTKEDMRPYGHRTSYDADFAKALKVFYQSMNTIRGHFLRLKHYKPPEEENIYLLRLFTEKQSQMFKDFWQQLESCICKLKNDVASIVKKKRQDVASGKS